ncbi:MAG: phosphate ABC transporter permease PstA [Candidatus Omnitrophica bacterium]|nr:phosphate ABC transporter permease PstA [Candidatus Omnitrophota bacterium]
MKIRPQRIKEILGFGLLYLSMGCVLLILGVIFYDIFTKGSGIVSVDFLSKPPVDGMTKGGIFPAIFGTFCVTIITGLLSVPLGMGCAIYLNEYARDNGLTRFIRLSIRNLSGVPSIVYGLFGVALFVQTCHFGTSILAAGCTLGLMTLPLTITASEEALKTVPRSYREGALALGATKWQSIRSNVLPYAVPGMLTGTILGLSRAAGETAPILFTGAAFFLPDIPNSVLSQFMALPYHLYIMSTQHYNITLVRPIAYGTALVLIALVFMMNLAAVIIRYRLRKDGVSHG